MLVHVFFLMVLFWSHTAEYCRLTVGVSISVCKKQLWEELVVEEYK